MSKTKTDRKTKPLTLAEAANYRAFVTQHVIDTIASWRHYNQSALHDAVDVMLEPIAWDKLSPETLNHIMVLLLAPQAPETLAYVHDKSCDERKVIRETTEVRS